VLFWAWLRHFMPKKARSTATVNAGVRCMRGLMLSKIIGNFRKPKTAHDPLNGYVVGTGYDLIIKEPQKIHDFSICQICLDVIENRTQNVPDSYWCCPDCASEAIEIPYMAISKFLKKYDSSELARQLAEWNKREDLVASYKKLKEMRYLKLIELRNVT
jgi:hypothetical protein